MAEKKPGDSSVPDPEGPLKPIENALADATQKLGELDQADLSNLELQIELAKARAGMKPGTKPDDKSGGPVRK